MGFQGTYAGSTAVDDGSWSSIPRPRWAALMVVVGIAGAAAVAAGLRSRWSPTPVSPELFLTGAPVRTLEARVSYPGADVHRPYGPLRSGDAGGPPPAPLSELARLEAEGDMHGLAAAYLVRRNAELAAPYLAKAGTSPDVASDKAIMALDQGDSATALALLEGVLSAQPKHAQALWNRSLVLRDLELWALTARSFDAVAALGEPGWAAEAKTRADAARARLMGTEDRREISARGHALVTQGEPVSAEVLRAYPGMFRMYLYEAIRAAPSVERLRALEPMAAVLDARDGGTALGDAIHRASGRDFQVRAPLARRYLELYRTHDVAGGLATFLEELRDAGEMDLYLGALVREEKVGERLEELAPLITRLGDPWFTLLLAHERASVAISRGELLQAEQHLLSAASLCQQHPLGYRCIPIEADLGDLYRQLHRLAESHRHLQAARALYRTDPRWGETQLLLQLGQLARYQGDAAQARAYLEEALAQRPDDCTIRHFVRSNDALALLGTFSVEQARERMREALSCKTPLLLSGAKTLSDLARLMPDPEQDARLVAGMSERRQQHTLTPGEAALLTHIEGRFLVEQDRARGEALLWQSIDEARRLPSTSVDARKARAYSYTSLLFAAARAGESEKAFQLFGEELGGALPGQCVLAVTVDVERTLVLARGPDGRLVEHHDASRRTPLDEELQGLVPESVTAMLRACPRVEVVARPPLHGRAGLLPEDLAWAYHVVRPQPSVPATSMGRRLVVAEVQAPASLGLPALGGWAGLPGDDATMLLGRQATPSGVLEAMADASQIEVHAHGLMNPDVSEASLLVLSPEAGGRYALTAGEVRATKLRGQPLVILAACRAAHGTTWTYERFSLPVAFLDAGARTVLAATVDVPDAEAGPFFNAVRERIQRGERAANALRDVRMTWMRRDPRSWVRSVLVFE
ncbi:CHAT domain-containing protein [Myxococcus sp. AM011]|uniref:CHAT domain-containing protein n=1 Tax=Myxococcus sp. AM011 TaxID=2745200 RepID=UPI0020CD09D1|nr:CHAT domain-containing protein [Myxococcus sp. AM011]